MYQPPDKTIWKGRTDPLDGDLGKRWHHIIQWIDLTGTIDPAPDDKKNIAILGFCCDEGVKRNQGRPGAKEGPMAIRRALRNLAVHFDSSRTHVYDAGDVICPAEQLERAQEMLGKKVYQLLTRGYQPMVIGGGHETAYGHFLGLHQFLTEQKKTISIINIDAHFDLRKSDNGGTSGTPFLQIHELLHTYKQPFHYFVMGINEFANTRALFDTAREKDVSWIASNELRHDHLTEITQQIDTFIARSPYTYLSIDLDAVQEAFAPGVSAPAPVGLDPALLRLLIKKIISLGTVLSVDIVELNPTYDIDSRTARLAAQVIYQVVGAS